MKTAIMLIAHGADESENNDSATRNRVRLREMTGMDVSIAYLHLRPTVEDTLRDLVGSGVERIIAVPLFVFPGFLSEVTVRKSFGLEPKARSGTVDIDGRQAEIVFTGTFADHPMIGYAMLDVCEENGAVPDDTAVMLIFHGNKTGAGAEYIDRCLGYLSENGFETAAAYNEFQSPTVEETTERLISTGKNILAIPMFVSPGGHTTSDIPPKLGLDGSDSRDIGNGRWLRYTAEIGMHPMVSDILNARIDEVL